MIKKKYRKESDSMGSMNVPSDALYGAQTARAIQNFRLAIYDLTGLILKP